MQELINEFIELLEGPINVKASIRFALLRKCYKAQDKLEEDNPVPSLDILSIGEFETILYALEEQSKTPGLSGSAYSELQQKLERLQNGVTSDKEQPTVDETLIKSNSEALDAIYNDQKSIEYPILNRYNDHMHIQLKGLEILLYEDGTWEEVDDAL